MNSLHFGNIHKNKLFCVIFLLLLSLTAVYMPHSLVESSEHHNYESSFKNFINNNKLVAENLRKLLKELKLYVNRLFRLNQILANRVALATTCLVFLNMRFVGFSKGSILYLFPFLCFYFHGSKYKHSMNHSDLIPLMGV